MNAMQKDTIKYLLTGLLQIAGLVLFAWLFAVVVTYNNEPAVETVEEICTSCGCSNTQTESFNIDGGAL